RPPSLPLFPYTTLFRSHQNHLSIREIARSCGLPTSTVGDYLKRAEAAGLAWPIPEELSEEQLLSKLLGSMTGPVASPAPPDLPEDRKSTRLNSSHVAIS